MKNFNTNTIFNKKICLRVCSVLVSVCMVFGIIGVSAFSDIKVFSNNLEQNFDVDLGETSGNIYFSPSVDEAKRVVLENGNGVLKIPVQAELGGAGAIGLREPVENKNYIMSFDFYAKQTDTKFMFQARDTGSKAFMMFCVGANGRVGFSTNAGWNDHNPDGSFYSAEYKANEWNNVDVLVDTSTQVMEYFINGVSVGSKKPEGNIATGIMSYISFFTGEGDNLSDELYIDNFRINYVEGNDFYAIARMDGNNVSVNFSEMPEMTNENKTLLTNIVLHDASTGEKVMAENVSIKGRSLNFTASLKADRQYTLILADGIESISGKTIRNKYVTFFKDTESDAYVNYVMMRDLSGNEYGMFSDIPVTQDYIKIITVGKAVDLNSASGISLKDEDGNNCALGIPSAMEDGIKIPVAEFLNPSKEYELSVSGLVAGNVQFPKYIAKFKTTSEAIDGFAEADIVLKDGSSVKNIEEGSNVFVSTRYVNSGGAGESVVIVIAAYSISSEINPETKVETKTLKMLDVDVKAVDMNLSRLTVIGPDNVEVGITVPAGADIIKKFYFQ